jgi:dihydropteroate synthase
MRAAIAAGAAMINDIAALTRAGRDRACAEATSACA